MSGREVLGGWLLLWLQGWRWCVAPGGGHYEMFGLGTRTSGVGRVGAPLRHLILAQQPQTRLFRAGAGREAGPRAPGAPLSHHERLQVKPRGFQAGAAQNQGPPRGPRAGLARRRSLRAAGCHRAHRGAPT